MQLTPHVMALIDLALTEDLGGGDITTDATIPDDSRSVAVVRAKEGLILAGLPVFAAVFNRLGDSVTFQDEKRDGDGVSKGDLITRVSGPTKTLLSGERTALNFLMRLCGIATLTNQCVQRIAGTETVVVDTRKTTPGWRALEKYAVRMGGGANHRFSLSDGVLIKDNHITAAGGITNAVTRARRRAPHTARIEVEVKNAAEIDEALEAGADILLLDNMTPEQAASSVSLVAGRAPVEVSGNMRPDTIGDYARIGVDFISMGFLTHSARSVDINMKIETP
ncbi:MAG: carboxylating nicotinate-nucleotide diphosphorylase [Deltaproteobacteria bacterium]|nr:carboxylating nicotinate-nucleotide diphosphorylase [Candidatus Zymogenaceae bacterium]